MPRSYSADLRERVLTEVVHGRSAGAAARRFQVSAETAARWVRQWHARAQRQARSRGRRPHHGSKVEPYLGFIRHEFDRRADLTLKQLTERLADRFGLRVSQATLSRVLRRHDLTFKERQRTPKSRTGLT